MPARLNLSPEQRRERRKEQVRRSREKHREKSLARARAYKASHRAEIASYNKAYAASHRAEIAPRNKRNVQAWNRRNRERKREHGRATYRRMKSDPARHEARSAYLREWWSSNASTIAARRNAAYSALKADASQYAIYKARRKELRTARRVLNPDFAVSVMAQLNALVSRSMHPDIRRDFINELYMELSERKTTLEKLSEPRSKDFARVRSRIYALLGNYNELSLDDDLPGTDGLRRIDTIEAGRTFADATQYKRR